MAWLVAGGYGMLAQDVCAELTARGVGFDAPDRDRLDITSPEEIEAFFEEMKPEVVVNCAAYTAVDPAEENEGLAFTLNAVAPQYLARAAAKRGIPLVQISTDYVFSGTSPIPYAEDDAAHPLGAYGRTKAAGEWAVRADHPSSYIVRTAWLYGAGGPCFPKTLARVLKQNGTANVVDDQHGQPTWTKDVARIIVDLVTKQAPFGIYHATSEGEATWYDFTRAIAAEVGVSEDEVHPVSTKDFPRPAPRPEWSLLAHGAYEGTGVEPIGPWQERWKLAAPSVLAEVE
ncbi:dTDP-4-dehydrorhamnose reductase [Actinomyces minihominis]|uniref:dTDP-4-dehydrorhamnose reductase n=1 Tax=Actinomyces minihominis TaxID=2002838 RepID=UPI000C07FC72|nr:dTDP-4-dehydrorhamnose reductase [Actinomyces minihominis]